MTGRAQPGLLLAAAVTLLSVGPEAGLSSVSVSPPQPGVADPIRIVVLGENGDACVSNTSTSSVDGDRIDVTIVFDPDQVCAQVPTSWSVVEEIGMLPLGSYIVTVTVEVFGCEFFPDECTAGTSFEVLPPGGPGGVPPTIVIDKTGTVRRIRVRWSRSCSDAAFDYGVYEGTLGDFGSHSPVRCGDTLGDLSEEIQPAPQSTYYLVVPHDGSQEGSHGAASSGLARQPLDRCYPGHGGPACQP